MAAEQRKLPASSKAILPGRRISLFLRAGRRSLPARRSGKIRCTSGKIVGLARAKENRANPGGSPGWPRNGLPVDFPRPALFVNRIGETVVSFLWPRGFHDTLFNHSFFCTSPAPIGLFIRLRTGMDHLDSPAPCYGPLRKSVPWLRVYRVSPPAVRRVPCGADSTGGYLASVIGAMEAGLDGRVSGSGSWWPSAWALFSIFPRNPRAARPLWRPSAEHFPPM